MRRLGDGRHKSRAAPLRYMGKLVREQAQRLRRIGRMSSAKRNRAAVGERVGILGGCCPFCHRPAIHAHTRWIDTRQRVQQRS
jgi:hypothetical protein